MSSHASAQNFELHAGDSRKLRIPIRTAKGQRVALDGASARWWLAPRSKSTGTAVLLKKSTEDPAQMQFVVEEEDGLTDIYVLYVYLQPSDTSGISDGLYYHEAEVTDATGFVATVMTGFCRIKASLVQ